MNLRKGEDNAYNNEFNNVKLHYDYRHLKITTACWVRNCYIFLVVGLSRLVFHDLKKA